MRDIYGEDPEEAGKWDTFWDDYFERQWMNNVPPSSWNIHDASDEVKDFINRTNNPIETYNRRLVPLVI